MDPSFEVLDRSGDGRRATVRFKQCDVALLIALRRIVLSEVETVAASYDTYDKDWQDIIVEKNTGCIHNEWLCHRISLLPIHFTREEVRDFDSARFRFELSASCDGHANKDVTSRDIVVLVDGRPDAKLARRLFPPDAVTGHHVLITRLRWSSDSVKEQIRAAWTVRKGTGKQHARWSPVSKCVYRCCIDQAVADRRRAEIADSPDALRHFDVLDVQRCCVTDKNGNPCEFDFTVESECGLQALHILDDAFGALLGKLEHLRDNEDALIPESPDPDDSSLSHIIITGEGHTLGAFIQAMIYELYMREVDDDARKVSFVGYHPPHPCKTASS
jgi:hypothetical protein